MLSDWTWGALVPRRDVVSDGLSRFAAVGAGGCPHAPITPDSDVPDEPALRGLIALPGNVRHALLGPVARSRATICNVIRRSSETASNPLFDPRDDRTDSPHLNEEAALALPACSPGCGICGMRLNLKAFWRAVGPIWCCRGGIIIFEDGLQMPSDVAYRLP